MEWTQEMASDFLDKQFNRLLEDEQREILSDEERKRKFVRDALLDAGKSFVKVRGKILVEEDLGAEEAAEAAEAFDAGADAFEWFLNLADKIPG